MKRRVILLGPPGSGKGTIAARLQADFGWKHISSGYHLRREAEAKTAVGERVKVFLENGELVPDELVLELMEGRLLPELDSQGFILDGFPRTRYQAEALDQWLNRLGKPLDAVLFINCPESVLLDRITGRRVCANCGTVYHMRSNPPSVSGRCDVCGGELTQREDDTEIVLRKRLDVYARETEPLVAYYRAQGKLVVVNTASDPEIVYRAAVKALNE